MNERLAIQIMKRIFEMIVNISKDIRSFNMLIEVTSDIEEAKYLINLNMNAIN
jgi:hypothetical protein